LMPVKIAAGAPEIARPLFDATQWTFSQIRALCQLDGGRVA